MKKPLPSYAYSVVCDGFAVKVYDLHLFKSEAQKHADLKNAKRWSGRKNWRPVRVKITIDEPRKAAKKRSAKQ